jgi:competence protein ComEA
MDTFRPIFDRLKNFKIEAILVVLSLVIVIISIFLYVIQTNSNETETNIFSTKSNSINEKPLSIFVDISGAVKKPDVYQFTANTRLHEVIKKAGGMTDEADKNYVARNFNLSRLITDQEKIYIPSVEEIINGVFLETKRTLDYSQPKIINSTEQTEINETNNELININSALVEELDTLPGVGKVTADKIIQNRPYESIEDLVTKKVVNKTVFEKIKEMITI